MFSLHDMDEKRARKELAQPQVWHAGDVSASPMQGEACELAGVTRAWQARHAHEHMEKVFPRWRYARGDLPLMALWVFDECCESTYFEMNNHYNA
jgi:hypothetical protein